MAVEIQGLEFQIQEDSAGAVAGLENLKSTLEQLKGATANAAGLGKVATALKNIGAAAQQLSSITGFKTLEANATSLVAAMKPLENIGKSGFSSMINGLKNVKAATESLNSADLDTFSTKIQQVTDAMKPLATEAANVYVALKWLPDMVNKVVNGTGKIPAVNGKAASSYTKLNGVLSNSTIRFAAVYMALKRLANIFGGFITKSNAYQENLNLFTVAMGEYAESAYDYGKKVSDVLGIDISDWIRNQGIFNTLATGFGVTADRAAIMSKNLTQLGYDISSFFNISVEESMQKLQSGVSGELEPLRRLGYDLSQARLEAVALSLGIDKSVSSMTQAEKAELRYYTIMNQVTTAQGDLARTLEAPANQLRILRAQFSMTARAIGDIFIPALNAILPYAIAVVQVIREIANALASLFGFKLTEVDYSGIDSLGSGAGVAADNLEDAAGAAKKLKSYTMGFDELNILDSSSSGGGASDAVGGGGGGFDFELPEYDFLGNAVTTRVDEIKKMLEKSLAEITVMVSGFALAVGAILVLTGANIPLGLGLMAAGAVGLAATIGLNWNGMSEQLANTLALITGVVGGFMLALGAIMAFSGANVPLGIALMALGAVSLATAAVVNWHSSDQNITDALTTITGILAGASLAVGAMLALTGVNTPLGIALMAIGAVSIASAVALNWNAMKEAISSPLSRISVIVGTAMLALGAILAFSGGSIPLGIALMALGATSIASAVALNWNGLSDEVINTVALITGALSVAFLAVGAALAFSGANIPLGIALMATGALTMGTAIIPNWNSLSDSVQQKITLISSIVGAALLGVGAILALTGVALPLGLGLMAVGALALGSAAALNWDTVVNAVKKTVSVITGILSGALIVLGVLLCLSGAGLGLGLAVLAAGLSLSYAAWTLDDNPITRFVRKMANSVIAIVNTVIDAINDLFHIQFKGLNIAGVQIIPAFDVRLVNIPKVPTFADGGFVDEGQLFIAREAGAEMVGGIGQRTAVANNDQIVEGISAGVSSANDNVVAAIYALLDAVENKDMTVNIGDEEVGRSYDRYSTKRGVRVSNGAFANAY
jgi:hypothetical protein